MKKFIVMGSETIRIFKCIREKYGECGTWYLNVSGEIKQADILGNQDLYLSWPSVKKEGLPLTLFCVLHLMHSGGLLSHIDPSTEIAIHFKKAEKRVLLWRLK